MILAPISDATVRAMVRRAALPEEDVFHRMSEVANAMRFGFPRLLVHATDDPFVLNGESAAGRFRIPTLAITHATLRSWEAAWRSEGLAVRRIDDSALRLRSLMRSAAGASGWVEGVFSDLTHLLGRGLPGEFKGFARRVMEYPARYKSITALGRHLDLSPGALKARFRRRGLPSPSAYLRWFRLLSACRLLSDATQTTLKVSFRLGFTSDGNFCRWVQAISGYPPSALRRREGRVIILSRLASDGFPAGAMEAWGRMGRFFLRDVA